MRNPEMAAPVLLGFVVYAVGCSSAPPPAVTLSGPYQTKDAGAYASFEFSDATHYSLIRNAPCDANKHGPGGCSEQGTYELNGTTLTLTESTTHEVTELPFGVISTGEALASAHILGAGLVANPTGNGTPSLTTGKSSALVTTSFRVTTDGTPQSLVQQASWPSTYTCFPAGGYCSTFGCLTSPPYSGIPYPAGNKDCQERQGGNSQCCL